MLPTHMYLWTNHLCSSLKHILVHLRLSLNYQNQTRTFQQYINVRKMDPRPIYFRFRCLMTNTIKFDVQDVTWTKVT